MAVGVDGTVGKPMVQEGQRMLIEVRRSLRDVFRKVPTMTIEVQVCAFYLARLYFSWHISFFLLLCCEVLNLFLFYFLRLQALPFIFRTADSYICEIIFSNNG